MPLFELIIDKFYNDIIFESKHLRDFLIDPWLDCVEINFCHINLLLEAISKLHCLHQFFLLVPEPTVLVGTGTLEKMCIRHFD